MDMRNVIVVCVVAVLAGCTDRSRDEHPAALTTPRSGMGQAVQAAKDVARQAGARSDLIDEQLSELDDKEGSGE